MKRFESVLLSTILALTLAIGFTAQRGWCPGSAPPPPPGGPAFLAVDDNYVPDNIEFNDVDETYKVTLPDGSYQIIDYGLDGEPLTDDDVLKLVVEPDDASDLETP